MTAAGFVPPPYPYDRLAPLIERAEAHDGGAIDLSIGTPCDPPPAAVREALAGSGTERGYPPSIGTPALREAVAGWFDRRFGVDVPASDVAACIGTKELVAGLPHWLRLRDPSRDTVLYPAVSYPSYAMGAQLAGCRAVPVPVDDQWRLDLTAIDPGDAERALCLWSNTPANPTGGLDDLRRGRGMGAGPRRPGVLRRVLRRVHLGRAPGDRRPGTRCDHPELGQRRRRRGPLAVEALEPGGPARGVLRGRPGAGRLPERAPQARRVHGPRTGAGRSRRGTRRRA